jgi:2-hydroxychromene-2-carboxylate isomerase
VSAVFYFDIGSPYAYLTAERIDNVLPGPLTWRALLLGSVFRATGRDSWARTSTREAGMAEVEGRASERGLPAITWPESWPNDGLLDPQQVLHLAEQQAVKDRLRPQTEETLALGVEGVPSVACTDGTVSWCDDQLESAAAHLRTLRAR